MRYFVHSGYINAWTIHKGLRKLGLRLECLSEQSGLLDGSPHEPAAGDTLFFADEQWLKRLIGSKDFHLLPKTLHIPIDDKLELARWLEGIGEKPIPYWDGHEAGTHWPIVLKARHSWLGERNLVTGYVCRTPQDLDRALRQVDADGVPRECFFLQKYLPGQDNNISTCGFFDHRDSKRNVIKVTCRVPTTRTPLVRAAIVQTIDAPAGLISRTETILSEMQFQGPFELEFLYDAESRTHYVLELNPRFWMQHGLFVDAFDNLVIKRYLGIADNDDCREPLSSALAARQAVWLNTIDFLQALARFDWRAVIVYLRTLNRAIRRKARICWYPDWSATCRFAIRGLSSRCRRPRPPGKPTSSPPFPGTTRPLDAPHRATAGLVRSDSAQPGGKVPAPKGRAQSRQARSRENMPFAE